MDPYAPGADPEIVPDANKSPGRMSQPVTEWWTSCCVGVQ